MPAQTSDKAILLSRVPYQESDLVLGLLCRQGGPLTVVARAARSSRRRFQGLLDFFIVFNAGLSVGRGGLQNLVSAEPVRFFPGILDELERLEAGQELIQTARDFLRDAPATPALFDSLELAFEYIENSDPSFAYMVHLEWVLSVAADLGHFPAGGVCPGCGIESRGFAVDHDGRVLCTERCQPGGQRMAEWPTGYSGRRPLQDNPALAPATWMPDRAAAREIVSALTAGVTGFPRAPQEGQHR